MSINAFMVPKNHEYIHRMKTNLLAIGVGIQILKPFHWALFENLFKLIKYSRKGYKIIHIHWIWVFPSYSMMKIFYLFFKSLRMKIVWEMHNILPHDFKESDRKKCKWFYENIDAVIFHSFRDISASKKALRSNITKQHIVIPHGSFNKSYENRVSKQEAREKLGISNDKRVILCFGFIRKNRGYEYLIKATRDMKNTIVIIAGKILEKDVYKELTKSEKKNPNLKLFARWIQDSEIQYFFNACDIVVLPYTRITTSGVIPLAYAFSRPIVTTEVGGLRDVVSDNTGILVPKEDEESLRKGIEKLFGMDYEKMGELAYKYSEEHFSWIENAKKIKKLYKKLIYSPVVSQ